MWQGSSPICADLESEETESGHMRGVWGVMEDDPTLKAISQSPEQKLRSLRFMRWELQA